MAIGDHSLPAGQALSIPCTKQEPCWARKHFESAFNSRANPSGDVSLKELHRGINPQPIPTDQFARMAEREAVFNCSSCIPAAFASRFLGANLLTALAKSAEVGVWLPVRIAHRALEPSVLYFSGPAAGENGARRASLSPARAVRPPAYILILKPSATLSCL